MCILQAIRLGPVQSMTTKPGMRGRWVDWGVFLPAITISLILWIIIIAIVRSIT